MSQAGMFCVLLMAAAAAAQTGRAPAERALPQWLTGLIAVTGFLFLTFIAFLVNRAWCGKSSTNAEFGVMMDADTYDTSLDTLRRKRSEIAYDNAAFHGGDEKMTAM
uniref:PDZK1-interacting protein 1 n=1 Tax=Tetraodon nigroviridis TaxID=99883 RepID=H3CE24_TETNG